jgi:hypothetical protein
MRWRQDNPAAWLLIATASTLIGAAVVGIAISLLILIRVLDWF